jgi:hypothetical protein
MMRSDLLRQARWIQLSMNAAHRGERQRGVDVAAAGKTGFAGVDSQRAGSVTGGFRAISE